MAQNITLLGASYSAVPAVVLPKTGGGTARFDDASVTTATASDVASGKIFLANNGTITTGTASGGSAVIQSLSVTQNGTYTAPTGVDGYSPVTVSVSGGGGSSSWTKVAETSYQVSTTSTSAATVATWETGDSSIWTSDKWVYVRTRDTEGKRNGYFYGTDTFFYNVNPINNTYLTSVVSALRITKRYMNDLVYTTATNGQTGYGVYPDTIYNNGNIRIRKRYNSNSSFTVDGTYKVEVYLLDPPTGAPIFE